MIHRFISRGILFLSLIAFLTGLNAQQTSDLTSEERLEVIDSITNLLAENYIFPDKAEAMGKLLSSNLEKGIYDGMYDPQAFARKLTEDLHSIFPDKHLRVTFNPQQVAAIREMQARPDDAAPDADMLAQMRFGNFGFHEVKILDGNIGYLDLRAFADAAHAGETAVAAMNFLSNSSALIIDLRNNGGGSPSMIQLITSYLYDQEDPVHLNNFYWRPSDETTQTWTLPYVPGRKLGKADVYVLTSSRTFSAAEEFTYNLKNLERATIVGETTGGGAHPGGTRVATDRFLVWVPSGRAINPITNTNWEGVGVDPDVEVPQDQALTKAHLMALETLAEAESPLQKRYQWYIPTLKAQLGPTEVSHQILKSYAGSYGPRRIEFKDGKLFYSRDGGQERVLIPLSEDLFFMEEIPYFRLQVVKEDGKIKGLKGLYDNGNEDFSPAGGV